MLTKIYLHSIFSFLYYGTVISLCLWLPCYSSQILLVHKSTNGQACIEIPCMSMMTKWFRKYGTDSWSWFRSMWLVRMASWRSLSLLDFSILVGQYVWVLIYIIFFTCFKYTLKSASFFTCYKYTLKSATFTW